jgi:hypothetical protein
MIFAACRAAQNGVRKTKPAPLKYGANTVKTRYEN